MFVCLWVSEIQVYWDADASKKQNIATWGLTAFLHSFPRLCQNETPDVSSEAKMLPLTGLRSPKIYF